MSEFRKQMLQGEILMLLHDIGKLHWRFVGPASGAEEDQVFEKNYSALHTLVFLSGASSEITSQLNEKQAFAKCIELLGDIENLPPLQQKLMASLAWLDDGGSCLTRLGSLLGLHHMYKSYDKVKKLCSTAKTHHPAVFCAMYADTADSLFSKGDESSSEEQAQRKDLHLARPLGGKECFITRNTVDEDAKQLAKAIEDWADKPASWNEENLERKRNKLRELLEFYGSTNLAETRLPNNDVSLWQHSYYAAAIFKALLASRILKGDWTGIISNDDFVRGDLIHIRQRLGLLAVRWNDAAYVARNVRSYDIVARRAHLWHLTHEIRTLVEDTLCLGNQIYCDHQGVCFLVPDLLDEGTHASSCFEQLCQELDNLCNGGNFQGELQWKLQFEASGLRLTDMLRLWSKPFDQIESIMPTADASRWQKEWDGSEAHQICPRCGIRPMPWSYSRTGGDEDKSCCKLCKHLREHGAGIIEKLRKGQPTDFSNYGQEAFGLTRIPDIDDFWKLVQGEDLDEDEKENRLALIQGIIPLDPLYDGSLFESFLSPFPKGYDSWDALVEATVEAWSCVRQGDVHNTATDLTPEALKKRPTGTVLDDLLHGFGGEDDGWCSDADPGKHQRRWIENLVFGGPVDEPKTPEEERAQAKEIIVWALRRHPSPSRMARIWEQTRCFMRNAFSLANDKGIPFVPLTCDAGGFQILMPARLALSFMRSVTEDYELLFGQVRHLLPLHLSAGVFYYKAPLYIAMDAARRFRRLADKKAQEWWTLESHAPASDGKHAELVWKTADGRNAAWLVPSTLPDGRPDPYHTWFWNRQGQPVQLADIKDGDAYAVRPSTFDFEVLDASTRRYDIRGCGRCGSEIRRPHFMMPRGRGPRPYPLEELTRWKDFDYLFSDKPRTKAQLKTALELVARLHADWDAEQCGSTFDAMLRDMLVNTLDGFDLSGDRLDTLAGVARNGTLFDLFEWHDFIGSIAAGGKE